MDLPPWGVVADGDRGVEGEAFLFGEGAVVEDLPAENGRVRNDDLLVLEGAYAGDEEILVDDCTKGAGDEDAVAELVRAHVGEDDAGEEVGNDGAGGERDEHSEKDRDALEGFGLPARQVGVGDDEGEDHDADADELVGGAGSVGGDAGNR